MPFASLPPQQTPVGNCQVMHSNKPGFSRLCRHSRGAEVGRRVVDLDPVRLLGVRLVLDAIQLSYHGLGCLSVGGWEYVWMVMKLL